MSDRRPLTPAMVAERWRCSERHVRNEINSGRLQHFKLGNKLIRIPAEAVETYECQSTASAAIAESSPSHGQMNAGSVSAARLARLTAQRQSGR